MALPTSFLQAGFLPPKDAIRVKGSKFRRLMLGTEGEANTGKSEFAFSAPGPGLFICLDRGFDAMLDNNDHPATRQVGNFAFQAVNLPMASQLGAKEDYLPYWRSFYALYTGALANAEARTVVLDGDSDSWELQRLAQFGKLTQIPGIMYTEVNMARRVMIARAHDSGKIVIATNKVGDEYVDDYGADGKLKMDNSGKPIRTKSGDKVRKGFGDHEYLWAIQIRHLYKKESTRTIAGKEIAVPAQFGLRILMCKRNRRLEGSELWGEDCCFQGLVQTVYPEVPLTEWGYATEDGLVK